MLGAASCFSFSPYFRYVRNKLIYRFALSLRIRGFIKLHTTYTHTCWLYGFWKREKKRKEKNKKRKKKENIFVYMRCHCCITFYMRVQIFSLSCRNKKSLNQLPLFSLFLCRCILLIECIVEWFLLGQVLWSWLQTLAYKRIHRRTINAIHTHHVDPHLIIFEVKHNFQWTHGVHT